MTEQPFRPLSEKDFEQIYPFDEFQGAVVRFIKQAEQNQISKTTKGSKRVFEFSNGARLDNHYGQGAASKAPYINYWWISIYWNTLNDHIVLATYFDTPDISPQLQQQLRVSFSNPVIRYTDIPGKGPVINLFTCRKDDLPDQITELYSKFMQSISMLDKFELTYNRESRYVSGGWRDKMLGVTTSRRSVPRLYERVVSRLSTDTDDEISQQLSDEESLSEIETTLEMLANDQPTERVNRIVSKIVRNPRIAQLIKERQGTYVRYAPESLLFNLTVACMPKPITLSRSASVVWTRQRI